MIAWIYACTPLQTHVYSIMYKIIKNVIMQALIHVCVHLYLMKKLA